MLKRAPRRSKAWTAVLFVAWLAPAAASAQDATVPRVRLVATGGTISNRAGGRLTAEELVKLMPGIEHFARPEFEQFANVASSELTIDQFIGLAKRLNHLFATEPDIAGLVVTSGTDTLEELAYFLNLTARTSKPGELTRRFGRAFGFKGGSARSHFIRPNCSAICPSTVATCPRVNCQAS